MGRERGTKSSIRVGDGVEEDLEEEGGDGEGAERLLASEDGRTDIC